MVDKEKILAGRMAIEKRHEAHRQLHSKLWHRGIPEEHTPLTNQLLAELKELGFSSVQEFSQANDLFIEQAAAKVYEVVGECNRCGRCCGHCEHLEDNLCSIYEDRPERCRDRITPIRLIRYGDRWQCSYSLQPRDDAPDDLKVFDFGWSM